MKLPARLFAAALLPSLALAAPSATFTVVEGNVRVKGDEEVCFRLTDQSMASDRLLVRVRFHGEVPRGRVELDGARSEPFTRTSEEIPFLVDPRGVHRLALKLEAPSSLDLLSVTSTETTVQQDSCSRYDFEAERRVSLEVPEDQPTNRFETPEERAARERDEAARQRDEDQRRTPAPAPAPAPATSRDTTMHVSPGTEMTVTMQSQLDSKSSYTGQGFTSDLDQEVRVGDRIVLPVGTRIEGHVAQVQDAGRFGRSEMKLAFDKAVLPDGQTVTMSATVERMGKGSAKKQAGIIAGSAIGGAILGSILGDGDTAKIGAVLGGAIAAGSIAAKPGESVVIPAGTSLTIRTDSAIDVAVPTR
jgi:hypothetical protein